MKSKQTEFRLKMNLMVQNLLLTSLGMCKFVMMHKDHPLSKAIAQFRLIDEKHLENFIAEVKKGKAGQTLILSLEDELLIYTAMDITCKSYLTDLGDEMHKLNASRIKASNSSFSAIRKTILEGCQFVMDGMRESLGGYPAFDDRIDILDNYILV
jgi:hypothetical protein